MDPLARVSSLDELVPAFRERYEAALAATKGQGYAPVVWETYRTHERAAMLVAQGRSKAKGGLSMHSYRVAADTICGAHQWGCARQHCRFFEVLGATLGDAGLVWGGTWHFLDLPHGQGVPVGLQDRVRALDPHTDTGRAAINALVVRALAGR